MEDIKSRQNEKVYHSEHKDIEYHNLDVKENGIKSDLLVAISFPMNWYMVKRVNDHSKIDWNWNYFYPLANNVVFCLLEKVEEAACQEANCADNMTNDGFKYKIF